jgi:hypothetical protein
MARMQQIKAAIGQDDPQACRSPTLPEVTGGGKWKDAFRG